MSVIKFIFLAIFIGTITVTLIGFIIDTIRTLDAKKRGDEFEEYVSKKIKRYLGPEVVRNVLFNKIGISKREFKKNKKEVSIVDLDRETELDMVYVDKKGIFCIECKSFLNRDEKHPIEGSLNTQFWKKNSGGNDAYRFQNPFDQNYKHVKMLKENGFYNVYNVVVTNSHFEFIYCGVKRKSTDKPYVSMLRNKNERMALIRQHGFANGIKEFAKDISSLPDVYSDKEVQEIYDALKKFEASREEREVHALAKQELASRNF